MTYLIDTHVLIWYESGNAKLSKTFIEEIRSPRNTILVSKVSLWEIAIKVSIGKLTLGISFKELQSYLSKKGIGELEFGYEDLQQLMDLPFYHSDPFDRLIISQALTRNCTIITDYHKFKSYSVQLLKDK